MPIDAPEFDEANGVAVEDLSRAERSLIVGKADP
jgi:hypothetical protein